MDKEGVLGTIITFPFQNHKIDALYFHVDGYEDYSGTFPVILRLHGLLGNLLDDTEHDLPAILATHGYPSLTMNTLLANLGLFFGFGIFDDTMPQIDAACEHLQNMGFRNIVIAGHGLGGCMAIRYASLQKDQASRVGIQGVIAIATAYSLPDTIRKRWERFGSDPSYDEVNQKAKRLFHPGSSQDTNEDETIVVKRAHGDSLRPEHTEIYTLKTWWTLAGPEADGPKTYRHIGSITVPILLVHGIHDDMIGVQECEALAQLAREAGNQDVTIRLLDAGHNLKGHHTELGATMANWLGERFR